MSAKKITTTKNVELRSVPEFVNVATGRSITNLAKPDYEFGTVKGHKVCGTPTDIKEFLKVNKLKAKDFVVKASSPKTVTENKTGKKVKSSKKDLKDGEIKIKKPLSAYFLYSIATRPFVKESNPEMSFADINKYIGATWKNLPASQKKPYIDEHERNRDIYLSLKPAKKAKGPGSAFILFSNDNRKNVVKLNPDISFGEIGKMLGQMWKGLSDKEKERYKLFAAKRKEDFLAGRSPKRSPGRSSSPRK